MPLPFAFLSGFPIGVVLAWLARSELEQESSPVLASRPFAVAAAFSAFVYGPIVAYFTAFHGDWSYLYSVPWQRIPSAVDLALVVLAALSVLIGFLAAARPAASRKLATLAFLTGVPAGALLLLAPLFRKRLAVSATYAQFHGGFGVEPIASSVLGRGVLVMAVAFGLGAAWAVWCLRRR